MKKIAVIGSGSWGTALANVLAENRQNVYLWGRNKEILDDIQSNHTNRRYLGDITLSKNICTSNNLQKVVSSCNMIVLVTPSHSFREVIQNISPYLNKDAIIVHASKGFEIDTQLRLSEVLIDVLPNEFHNKIVVLSGPSHAEEVVLKLPTTIVAASSNKNSASFVQEVFSNDYFRVYTNDDVVGVELGGSLKNIVALAAGLSDGLGYGDNSKAAILTRGLSEIIRIGTKLGAKKETFSGLTGIGDLIVTGTSKHSRNWKTGYLLAKGLSPDDALRQIGMVAEGIKATKVAYLLSKKHDIDSPITHALYEIIFNGQDPSKISYELMTRVYKDEI